MEEVHIWRGSPEQRVQRKKMCKTGQFIYFDKQLNYPDWNVKTVLDFGGNIGNLLQDSNEKISQENYHCIDVLEEALEIGRKRFPHAHWYHYDRYNPSFNPGGKAETSLPVMGIKFHMILAYSVFTHTTLEDMHDLIDQLHQCLHPGGILAFTFFDPHYRCQSETKYENNLHWRLEKNRLKNPEVDVTALLNLSNGAQWCTLVGDSTLYLNSNGSWPEELEGCLTYNVFHTAEFIQQEFPSALIRPPVNGEMQHCCLIHR